MPGTVRMVQPPPDPQPAAASREICIELSAPSESDFALFAQQSAQVWLAFSRHLIFNSQRALRSKLDFTPENSGEITKRYASERWHICAMSRLAILATDRYIDKMLLQGAPLYSVSQYMLCRPVWRRTDQARCVLMVRDLPSEAQFWAQQDKHLGAETRLRPPNRNHWHC